MKRVSIILGAVLLAVITGCSDKPDPESVLKQYTEAWENQDYKEMYSFLSESSKEVLSEEEFVERYTTIYDGIQMSDLEVTYETPEDQDFDKEDQPSLSYQLKMNSLGGEINDENEAEFVFEESEDGDHWAVRWDSSMIFSQMAEGDKVRAQTLNAERGEIFDINGDELAVNGVVQQVGLVPERMPEDTDQAAEVKETLADELNISVEYIDDQLNQSWVQENSYVPLASVADDDEEKIEAIRDLSGSQLQDKNARVYPLGEAAAHLTGYVGSVTAEQLEELEGKGYSASSLIGQTGLESVLEEDLRGQHGGQVVINSADGNEKAVLAEREPKAGKDFNLTIDADVQSEIYDEMSEDSGSAAAINPTTGQVSALVSSPAYDPNEFILGMSNERRKELQENDQRPLTNKFTANYSPGSTFKPITAAIGLESGDINPEEEMTIPEKKYTQDGWGDYSVTRVDGANKDKSVTLKDALVRSDNIYFARTILNIGGETFLEKAADFGFGEEIPFPYPISSSQILNDESFGKEQEILLADTGYGQGQVQMSSLHVALTYTPFITNGTLLEPVLFTDQEQGKAWHENVVSEETASIIRQDLTAVVDDPAGSAHQPQIEGIQLAGKTGTAELKKSLEDENAQENGWFVGWDREEEDLLVSMMIEDVEEGSSYVVEKVKNVFQELE
ncbi:penicillin-binding transpeptidase domain-containing protein [Halobacillus massiliensis]|uniref:penicillin-binding transpeptidase domain-containing protein n=1 Tax=Halobacillus massiliensis TaxID=1926286 RepID=UPI0009E27942|nr:penicillin-binding transpeptidase domain-containing protein [Halobacillus massiliensis]